MTFWQGFACLTCGTVSTFLTLFILCACVLAGRADEARKEAQGDECQ